MQVQCRGGVTKGPNYLRNQEMLFAFVPALQLRDTIPTFRFMARYTAIFPNIFLGIEKLQNFPCSLVRTVYYL